MAIVAGNFIMILSTPAVTTFASNVCLGFEELFEVESECFVNKWPIAFFIRESRHWNTAEMGFIIDACVQAEFLPRWAPNEPIVFVNLLVLTCPLFFNCCFKKGIQTRFFLPIEQLVT